MVVMAAIQSMVRLGMILFLVVPIETNYGVAA